MAPAYSRAPRRVRCVVHTQQVQGEKEAAELLWWILSGGIILGRMDPRRQFWRGDNL